MYKTLLIKEREKKTYNKVQTCDKLNEIAYSISSVYSKVNKPISGQRTSAYSWE